MGKDTKENLREQLCEQLCVYFKPFRKEDTACEGYVVIERLLKINKAIPFMRPSHAENGEMQEILRQTICPVCPYYVNDCDFILYTLSPSRGRQSSERPLPCGGFLLLAHHLERDIISIDDIKDII